MLATGWLMTTVINANNIKEYLVSLYFSCITFVKSERALVIRSKEVGPIVTCYSITYLSIQVDTQRDLVGFQLNPIWHSEAIFCKAAVSINLFGIGCRL